MTSDLNWYGGRPVVVTGGLGFIGSHLVERLVDLGAEVTVIDSLIPGHGGNPFNLGCVEHRVRISHADVRDRASLPPLLADTACVFNLAGQVSHIDSVRDPEQDLELNVRASLVLVETLRTASPGARVVFASTRQVYGRQATLPVSEGHPVNPVDINGINKRAAERYHLLAARTGDLAAVVLRLTNTYGPRQLMSHDRQGFIPVFIRRALENGPIELFGGGTQVRDANYVADVVDAFVLAGAHAEERSGRIYNLGGKPPFTLREFAELLVSIVGRGRVVDADWPSERHRIDIGDFVSDPRLIGDELGWTPSRDLADGLVRTVAFYRRHGEHYW